MKGSSHFFQNTAAYYTDGHAPANLGRNGTKLPKYGS